MGQLFDGNFLKKYSIRIGIGVIFLLIINNFIVAIYGRLVLEERNEFINQRIIIDQKLAEMNQDVNLLDLGFRGYYMVQEEGFKEPYNIAIKKYEKNLDILKNALGEVNYSDVDSVDFIKEQIRGYAHLVREGIDFIESGAPEKAVELFVNDPGYDLWKSYSPIQISISDFIAEKEAENKAKYKSVTAYSFFTQLLTLALGLPVLLFVIFRLRRNEGRMQSLFQELSKSNQSLIYNDGVVIEKQLEGDKVISGIIGNLKKATTFIQGITGGNLDVTWDNNMSTKEREANKETLVGELTTMRDQMKNVKEQEKIRYWIAEGLSIFSKIVRDNQGDLETLTDELIAKVVKYTDSKQGGLFLLNEDDPDNKFLELTSSYAYERKKFLKKKMGIGEGVLGQVYLEAQTTRLKEIPDNYLKITSGLGQALPKTLILVPVKVNENIQGVMELASFNDYEDHHIELLEKIGEITASAIVNGKIAQQTQHLLQQSQENEEQMRSQEEEMRQNMEELQATQEQEKRTREELEKKILELNKELEAK